MDRASLARFGMQIADTIESCKPSKKRGRPSHKRQLQEIREEKKINLQTSDSVIVATNLKSILTLENLQSLSAHHQSQLARLLPEFDQVVKSDGNVIGAADTALNNEYFARFCNKFVEKLSENGLSDDAIEQAKNETSRELAKLDPWKLKNYEPIWGQKLISQLSETPDSSKLSDNLVKRDVRKRSQDKRRGNWSEPNKRKTRKQ